jgi:outer membrane protein assembly factor BamB
MKVAVCLLLLLQVALLTARAQPAWQVALDSKIRFYQTTDFGIVLAGTERSLYAVDGQTGERIWRRDTGRINETAVAPVPDTDLILLSRDLGERSRLEAVDLMSGARIWQSDKVKGDVLQLAADPQSDLVAVVLVKDPRGEAGKEFKGKPIIHMLRLSTGDELWKRELDSDVEMMPARFGEGLGEIAYTLDNYRAPLLLDGRLFLFYDGMTSCDAWTGKEKEREKFKVNEEGLALTEADPVFDDSKIYISGRGRIRAVDRRSGNVVWKADDLGTASEMVLLGDVLYVRTGGQFTRLKDGDAVSKGPFGVSAIDIKSGDTMWRFKGADKGLTNFIFADAGTIVIADKDDVVLLDTRSGERKGKFEHKVERAQFVLLNERGDPVIGGRDEIASFDTRGSENWRVRHKAPGRGAFAIIGGIALRAAALYFRYGGLATSAFGVARGGLGLVNTANSFRWSGLSTRFGSFDLTTLATNSARNFATRRIYSYGSLARLPNTATRISGLQIERPSMAGRLTPTRDDVQESALDRLDPTRYADKLAGYLLRRKRLAELRGNYMYFYTDLPKPFGGKGLIGVNIQTGQDGRFILASDPDRQFVTDETVSLLYSADGSRLQAFDLLTK